MNEGLYELASDAYLELIRSDEQGSDLRNARRAADLLIRTGSWTEAKRILAGIRSRYGRQLTGEDELSLLTLEAKVARGEGRDREAAKVLESIVERDGTRGEALLELAAYYRDQGEIERAILLVERAEKLERFQYKALLEHAQLRVGERDYREAAALLKRALQIKSEPRVERFLARVEQAIRPL